MQYNSNQNYNGSFHRNKKEKILIFHFMEPQKTPNSQINLKKKQQSCRDHTSWPQAILQSYSNQKSMALA